MQKLSCYREATLIPAGLLSRRSASTRCCAAKKAARATAKLLASGESGPEVVPDEEPNMGLVIAPIGLPGKNTPPTPVGLASIARADAAPRKSTLGVGASSPSCDTALGKQQQHKVRNIKAHHPSGLGGGATAVVVPTEPMGEVSAA